MVPPNFGFLVTASTSPPCSRRFDYPYWSESPSKFLCYFPLEIKCVKFVYLIRNVLSALISYTRNYRTFSFFSFSIWELIFFISSFFPFFTVSLPIVKEEHNQMNVTSSQSVSSAYQIPQRSYLSPIPHSSQPWIELMDSIQWNKRNFKR